jgi:hypothetical protein
MIDMSPPPMSGETPPPIREAKAEKAPKPVKAPKPIKKDKGQRVKLIKAKLKSKPQIIFIALSIILFIVGIFLGLVLRRRNGKQPVVTPSPSPMVESSPSPLPSASPKALEEKVNQFEQHLEEVDLKEEELTPPVLDFDIRFEVRQ